METEAFVIPVIFSGYFFLSAAKETLITKKELNCTDFTSRNSLKENSLQKIKLIISQKGLIYLLSKPIAFPGLTWIVKPDCLYQ